MKGIGRITWTVLVLLSLNQHIQAQVLASSEQVNRQIETTEVLRLRAEALLHPEYKRHPYKILSTQVYRSVGDLPNSLSPLFYSWLASPQVLADMVERIQPGDTTTLHLVRSYQQRFNKAIDWVEGLSFDGFVAIHQLEKYSKDASDNIRVTVLSLLSRNMKCVLESKELSYKEGFGYQDLLAAAQAIERYKRLYAEKLKARSQTEGIEVYDVVAVSPVFRAEGGDIGRYLFKRNRLIGHQSCPPMIGRTLVQCVILPSGDIERLHILRSSSKFSEFGDLLDFEALRLVLSMPRWLPAGMNGHPVACKYIISVRMDP